MVIGSACRLGFYGINRLLHSPFSSSISIEPDTGCVIGRLWIWGEASSVRPWLLEIGVLVLTVRYPICEWLLACAGSAATVYITVQYVSFHGIVCLLSSCTRSIIDCTVWLLTTASSLVAVCVTVAPKSHSVSVQAFPSAASPVPYLLLNIQ